MRIFVNDQSQEVSELSTIASIVNQLNINVAAGIAIALNQEVVPQSAWNDAIVNENDAILIIKATKGG